MHEQTIDTTPPKIFISYSWTNDEHANWVLDLATRLRKHSYIDVVLDRWDLQPGQDKFDFMEQMVKDPTIKKVLIICDKRYVERANQREGGVGTESTIISQEVYNEVLQEKFVPVLSERDINQEPFLPIFLKSRIYIDLSDPRRYEAGYEELVRNIGGKPLHIKPPLGKGESFIFNAGKVTSSTTYAKRALEDALLRDKRHSTGLAEDYLNALVEELLSLRLDAKVTARESIPITMVERLEQWTPFRDELIDFLRFIIQYGNDARLFAMLPRFFEKALAMATTRYSDSINEHINFIIHEAFLYTIATLLQKEKFEAVSVLLDAHYDDGEEREVLQRFGLFAHLKTEYLEKIIQSTWEVRYERSYILWKLIQDRANLEDIPFAVLREADFILYLRFRLEEKGKRFSVPGLLSWIPNTFRWDYLAENGSEFPIFKRATSRRYFARFKSVIGVENKEDLLQRWHAAFPQANDDSPIHWEVSRNSIMRSIVSPERLDTT